MANKAKLDARGWRQDGVMRADHRARWGYPRRQAVRYSARELHDIQAQYRQGFDVDDIAEYHERTANGVSIALERMHVFGKEPLSIR